MGGAFAHGGCINSVACYGRGKWEVPWPGKVMVGC